MNWLQQVRAAVPMTPAVRDLDLTRTTNHHLKISAFDESASLSTPIAPGLHRLQAWSFLSLRLFARSGARVTLLALGYQLDPKVPRAFLLAPTHTHILPPPFRSDVTHALSELDARFERDGSYAKHACLHASWAISVRPCRHCPPALFGAYDVMPRVCLA